MKNFFLKLLIVTFMSFFTLSCNSDDDNTDNQNYPANIQGTTWYRQATTTESGQTIEVEIYLVFDSPNTGHLKADSDATGVNITQTYDFTYVYSQGSGTAEFDDSNIGTQNFTISGNQLTMSGEILIRQ